MKFFRFPLLSALLSGGVVAIAGIAPASAADYAPGEILVRVSPAAPAKASALRAFAAKSGAKSVRSYAGTGWQKIKLPAGTSVEEALEAYKKQSGVIAAEPNIKLYALKTANDKFYKNLYGLTKIGAPAAWNVNQGSRDVVVAVCDTGIKYNHPDLAANMWTNGREIDGNGIDDDGNGVVDDIHGFDAVNEDGDPMDDNGHGTHCAGTIGAVGNNSIGVTGVNWKVKLMGLKFLDADGFSFSDAILDSYAYAIAAKKSGVNLRVISNSWGGIGKSEAIFDIMQEAADEGIVSICAAGNESTNNDLKFNTSSNNDVTGLVAVGATDDQDAPADFSNYGRKTVDLYAPGVDILSTWIGKNDQAYEMISGTSMACPHVAGAAALLLAQAPSLTPAQVKTRLLAAVDKLPSLKKLCVSEGRLNLAKLLSGSIYSVRGTVYDNANKPLVGAQVFIDKSKTVSAITTDKGTYSIDGLAPGVHTASAKLKGWKFTPTPASVNLSKSYVGKIDFKGKAEGTVYTISGSVYKLVGEKKVFLKGVRLTLGDSSNVVAVTNAEGKYSIPGRAAGTYYVSAALNNITFSPVGQISLDGSGKIVLPAKKPNTGVLDFVNKGVVDTVAPIIVLNSPKDGGTYTSGSVIKASGTARDESGVSSMRFVLGRFITGSGMSYYQWTQKIWADPVQANPTTGLFPAPADSYLDRFYNGNAIVFSIDFPELADGDYYFNYLAYDKLGNRNTVLDENGELVNRFFRSFFTVDMTPSTGEFPDVTIYTPNNSKLVPADTVVTAKGIAEDANGIESVYLYLRRYDENGNVIRYYNWVKQIWVAPNDLNEECYNRYAGNSAHKVNWSYKLPKMPEGVYEIGVFGHDVTGDEPPEDQSGDTLSSFTVKKGLGTTGTVKAPSAPSS